MEKEAEKFLQAEETAVKLAEALKKLYTEATSYQTATKEIDTVRKRLAELIDSTEKLVIGSREVINVLKKIGGPEILNKISEVLRSIEKLESENSKMIISVKNEILKSIESIKRGNSDMLTSMDKISEVLRSIEKLESENSKMIISVKNEILQSIESIKRDNWGMLASVESRVLRGVIEESAKQFKILKRMETLIILALASSIISAIIGAIALLK